MDGRQRFRHLWISGGQITCRVCQQWTVEVVLLEADRPLCVTCAGKQLDADIETVREWLRSLAKRGANLVEEFTAATLAWR